MEEWKEYKLGDICEFQNGYAFKSSDFSTDGKYRVVKIKELKDGLVKFFEDSSFVECDDNTILEKYSIKKGDVLFALTGDPVSKPNPNSWVGRVALYNKLEKSLLNQRVCKVQPKELINPFFLYYYFRQRDVFYSLASKATGSASQANISTKTIGDLIVNIPSLEIQNKIASILSSLDDKIEVNRRLNENLEQQAQALFKSWFVDFEPFKNGEFVESELGMIPKGWRVVELSDLCNIKYGKGLGKQQLLNKGYPVFGGNGIIGYYTKYLYDLPQILVSCRGAASGKINESEPYSYVTSNSLILETKNRSVYNYLKYFFYNNPLYEYATGSAQPQITIDNIRGVKILYPSADVISSINSIFAEIGENNRNTLKENRLLSDIRDTLLPRLMFGELKVNEIENVL